MIVVDVFGKVKKKKEVKKYAEDILVDIGSLIHDLFEVEIKFVTAIEGDDYGYAIGDDELVEVVIAKNVYGNKVPFREQLVTLAHELVHAKQFAYNQEPTETECDSLEEKLFEKHWKLHDSAILFS